MTPFLKYMRKEAVGPFYASNPVYQMTGEGGNGMLPKKERKPLDPWAKVEPTSDDPEDVDGRHTPPEAQGGDTLPGGTGGVIG